MIGFVAYRYLAPVRVDIVGVADGVPFTIETIPHTVLARPGEMVKVVYRIQNNDLMPMSAYGAITIGPAQAQNQMEVFLSQCGGINTYQNSSRRRLQCDVPRAARRPGRFFASGVEAHLYAFHSA